MENFKSAMPRNTRRVIPENRRVKMLAVIDGYPEIPHVMYHFNSLKMCDPVLDYLLVNHLTGKRFLEFFKENNSSVLKTAIHCLKKICRDDRKAIYARDFR